MFKHKGCEFELRVVKAVKSGFVGDDISGHLKICSNCRETATVVGFFHTNLKNETLLKLPAAGFLWWKSKIIEKRRRAERVAQPILIAQIAAVVVAFLTLVWLFGSKSGQLILLNPNADRAFVSIERSTIPLPAARI